MDALIDPTTGAYVESGATLLRDPANGLANAVYLRIATPLGSYWADPTMGSRLHELTREKDVPRVERLAKQYCEQALQPLLDDGRVLSLNVATQRKPGRLHVRVELIDAHHVTQTFEMHVKVG